MMVAMTLAMFTNSNLVVMCTRRTFCHIGTRNIFTPKKSRTLIKTQEVHEPPRALENLANLFLHLVFIFILYKISINQSINQSIKVLICVKWTIIKEVVNVQRQWYSQNTSPTMVHRQTLYYNLSSPQPLVGRSPLSATWDALGSSGCCPLGTVFNTQYLSYSRCSCYTTYVFVLSLTM